MTDAVEKAVDDLTKPFRWSFYVFVSVVGSFLAVLAS
jgi:hypothetical protein